jgi:hypothetical protein
MKILVENEKYYGFQHLITDSRDVLSEKYSESEDDDHKRLVHYLQEVNTGDGKQSYCPFVKIIKRHNGYYFRCFSVEQLGESFSELEKGFKLISPLKTTSEQKVDPVTVIAAFPEQKALSEDFCKLLEQERNNLRLSFLTQGLMVAYMHPFHTLGSAKEGSNLIDEQLYVSNIPLLMVRRMHKEDIVFMHTEIELNAYYYFFSKGDSPKCPFNRTF